MEQTAFATEDGIRIVGSFYPGIGERGVILAHMMPAARESWAPLAERLQAEGFDVLAIDLRGHGESVRSRDGRTIDFRDMNDEEHQDSRLDLAAARDFLTGKGITSESISVGGASFGANLALEYMADNPECVAGFLLSPGRSYRSLESAPLAERLGDDQSVYIAAARDDANERGAAGEAEELAKHFKGECDLHIFETGGHGTDILAAHPELLREIADWLSAATMPLI